MPTMSEAFAEARLRNKRTKRKRPTLRSLAGEKRPGAPAKEVDPTGAFVSFCAFFRCLVRKDAIGWVIMLSMTCVVASLNSLLSQMGWA